MAARIIYEGNARASGGGGGDLFAGLTMFLTQKVPMRPQWEGLVQANGGSLTLIDRAADVVIADHARQNPIAGSTSWKWIDDSVKEGVLKDRAAYTLTATAQRSNAGQQRSGPRTVTRQLRVPFNAEDDRELKRFCIRQMRLGKAMAGNVIYHDFARTHPRHTDQSWRERWLRKLQYETLTDEDREEAARESGDEAQESEEVNKDKLRAPVRTRTVDKSVKSLPSRAPPVRATPAQTVPRCIARSPIKPEKITPQKVRRSIEASPMMNGSPLHSTSPGTPASRRDQPVRAGNPFTKYEVDLLVDEYDAILDLDSDRMIDAWLTWERAYPTHTAQEWSNYFNKEIKGKVESPKKRVATPPFPATKSSQPQNPCRNSRRTTLIDSPPTQPLMPVKASQAKTSRLPSQESHQSLEPEIKDSQKSSNKTILSIPRPLLSQEGGKVDAAEVCFNDRVGFLAERLFPDHEVDLYPIICNMRLSLFKLWNMVGDACGCAAELDKNNGWSEVAAAMGFENADIEEAGRCLQDCYYEILPQLDEYLKEIEERTESQAEELAAAQRRESLAPYSGDDSSDDENVDIISDIDQRWPSNTGSRKRPSPRDLQSTNGKRARVDKGKSRAYSVLEIPSTPEEEIKVLEKPRAKNSSQLRQALNQTDVHVSNSEDDDPWGQAIASPTPFGTKSTRQHIPPILCPSSSNSVPFPQERPSSEAAKCGQESVTRAPKQQSVSGEVVKPKSKGAHITNGTLSSKPTSSKSNDSTTSVPPTRATAQKSAFAAYQERMVALGYTQHIVAQAVRATSMKIGGNSSIVMESLRNGSGIPENMPGVWTDSDDKSVDKWREALETGQLSKAQHIHDRLASKHGATSIEARNQFLLKIIRNGK